jgi:hypothetical protein
LTDVYREGVQDAIQTVKASTRLLWSRIPRDRPDLDSEYDTLLGSLVPLVVANQSEAIRLSGGYLAATLTAETGERATASVPRDGIGLARDGRPLDVALRSPLILVKSELKQGQTLDRALQLGERRALLMAGLAVDAIAQQALLLGIDEDDRFDGWQRAVRGTCGACLGSATGPDGGFSFPKHPNCRCVSEPRVRGVRDRFPRPTGAMLFAAMSDDEQDAAVGPKVAEAIRTGSVTLADLVGSSAQAQGDDYLTQAPALSR